MVRQIFLGEHFLFLEEKLGANDISQILDIVILFVELPWHY